MTDTKLILAIMIMSLLTMATRFAPFIIFSGRETPRVVSYLGKVLPYAIIGMLVVFCLKNVSFGHIGGFMPEMIASAVVAGTYAWKRKTLPSIIIGTACYMLLVQFVFI